MMQLKRSSLTAYSDQNWGVTFYFMSFPRRIWALIYRKFVRCHIYPLLYPSKISIFFTGYLWTLNTQTLWSLCSRYSFRSLDTRKRLARTLISKLPQTSFPINKMKSLSSKENKCACKILAVFILAAHISTHPTE